MFGGMSHKLSILSKKATGGGADVTPNAINWSNVEYNGITGFFTYTERKVTRINTTITLRVESDTSEGVYVLVSNSARAIVSGDGSTMNDPGAYGMEYMNPGDVHTFTVSNNQYVTFGHTGNYVDSNIKIFNDSDGGLQIDTFDTVCVNC